MLRQTVVKSWAIKLVNKKYVCFKYRYRHRHTTLRMILTQIALPQTVSFPSFTPGAVQDASVQFSGDSYFINLYDVQRTAEDNFSISKLTSIHVHLAMVRVRLARLRSWCATTHMIELGCSWCNCIPASVKVHAVAPRTFNPEDLTEYGVIFLLSRLSVGGFVLLLPGPPTMFRGLNRPVRV
jgi:hypothetical protein